MSWRLIRGCAISLWLLTGVMIAVAITAGINGLSVVGPIVLAVSTLIAGVLAWRASNQHKEAFDMLDQVELPPEVAESLIMSLAKNKPLSEEEYIKFEAWANNNLGVNND